MEAVRTLAPTQLEVSSAAVDLDFLFSRMGKYAQVNLKFVSCA